MTNSFQSNIYAALLLSPFFGPHSLHCFIFHQTLKYSDKKAQELGICVCLELKWTVELHKTSSPFQRISKLHHWFISFGDFAQGGHIAY